MAYRGRIKSGPTAMTMTFTEILQYANDVTVVALLGLIIYSGKRRWWVFGWIYDRERAETEHWRRTAFHLLGITKRGLRASEKALGLGEAQEGDEEDPLR